MKKCIKCERAISDDAKFCTKCGTRQPADTPHVFCSQCGRELPSDAIYCAYCAQPVNPKNTPRATAPIAPAHNAPGVVVTISEREKISAIFWAIVGVLQLICGFIWIPFDISGLIFLGIGALNLWSAYNSFKFSKRILGEPVGILLRYEKIVAFVITLVYNLIIFIIGLVEINAFAIIIGLFAVVVSALDIRLRSFVLQNREELAQLELRNQ
ncbi:zinc ribbon domain-containing protein [Christensenellaceae bacterium OttesenSCG-928-K19]|nr:zinc ribbon domain-containing protein [Christensenellaceae bacterium OttesenSCG-928-K19]